MFLLQIQPISVEHGEPPLQQISFRSTSTSCEAKWTSFSKRHRLVRLMSADLLYCTLGRTCFCFQSQEEKVVSVLDDGCGVERNSQLSLLKCRKKKNHSKTVDGQGILALWTVHLSNGLGKEQNEALWMRRSNCCSTGTLLHFVCECTSCLCELLHIASIWLFYSTWVCTDNRVSLGVERSQHM